MNTEQDTFDKLKGLTAVQMFVKLQQHHAECNTHLNLFRYLTITDSGITVIKERNELLKRFNWKHKDFMKEAMSIDNDSL